jgi:hypothetical protein
MSKTIAFNPDLMKVSAKRSRASSASPKISMRAAPAPPKAAKRSILAYMNKKQHANAAAAVARPVPAAAPAHDADSDSDSDTDPTPHAFGDDDFGDSLQYMTNVAARYKDAKAAPAAPIATPHRTAFAPRMSYTVRAHSPVPAPAAKTHAAPAAAATSAAASNAPDNVVHGCLKGGRLPTYRQYRRTLRAPHSAAAAAETFGIANPPPHAIPKPMVSVSNLPAPRPASPARAARAATASVDPSHKSQKKFKRRKKTVKRTFIVGKSKEDNTVSVLVSNRTVRSKIRQKLSDLKEVPIAEIRRYLLKNSLIKAGSATPHSILREMYESAHMLCGQVTNRNADTLLHNFLNDDGVLDR